MTMGTIAIVAICAILGFGIVWSIGGKSKS